MRQLHMAPQVRYDAGARLLLGVYHLAPALHGRPDNLQALRAAAEPVLAARYAAGDVQAEARHGNWHLWNRSRE